KRRRERIPGLDEMPGSVALIVRRDRPARRSGAVAGKLVHEDEVGGVGASVLEHDLRTQVSTAVRVEDDEAERLLRRGDCPGGARPAEEAAVEDRRRLGT